MAGFVERHRKQIRGVLSCWDRVVIRGTLPDICHAEAMAGQLRGRRIRIFDYTKFVGPFRDELRACAERVAAEAGREIEFIRKKDFRKEERVKQVVAERGDHPGLVHIFSAMEPCASFQPWHDKETHRTFLKPKTAKCLHYYFYFIDEALGLCYLRIPTWAPFRLQFYFNGHHWLAAKLRERGIAHRLVENAFLEIADFPRAQELVDRLHPQALHRKLDHYAHEFCPVLRHFPAGVHWSLMQAEYATDLVFRRRRDLTPLYERLIRTAIHAVKPEHVATFLGRKLHPNYRQELGTDFHTRIQGTRIKHHMGRVALKMYDKLGVVLRIETVVNDPSFFQHHRKVEHRDGTATTKLAPMKKTIYSLPALRRILTAANHRYLEFLSTLDDPEIGDALKRLEKLSRSARKGSRSYRGFNFFDPGDLALMEALVRGEFHISGLRNRDLRRRLGLSGAQASWVLRRLRFHGLVKKIAHTYKYYLTKAGQRAVVTALKLRQLVIIPSLAEAPATP